MNSNDFWIWIFGLLHKRTFERKENLRNRKWQFACLMLLYFPDSQSISFYHSSCSISIMRQDYWLESSFLTCWIFGRSKSSAHPTKRLLLLPLSSGSIFSHKLQVHKLARIKVIISLFVGSDSFMYMQNLRLFRLLFIFLPSIW